LFSFEITCSFNGDGGKLLTQPWLRLGKASLLALPTLLAALPAHALDGGHDRAESAATVVAPANPHRVYVIGNGWHAGLLLPAGALNVLVPGLQDRFPAATSYELGWGDIGFYQAKQVTVGLAFQALFASKGSVLHVVGIQAPAERFIQGSDAVVACFTEAQLQSMAAQIAETFVRGPDGKAVALGKGIYGDSEFYKAKGRYSAFNTCNRWSAIVLHAGGLPIHTRISLTASSVLSAVRQQGRACPSSAPTPPAKADSPTDAGVPSRPRS
jgi:uncharacterized protein (TIGR02117 family)